MLLLALAGCFDSATTTIFLDVKRGEAHVLQQMHNAWPDEIGCAKDGVPVDDATCVSGLRAYLAKATTELTEGGATVARGGVVLDGGRLDLLYDYTAMAGSKALSDQGITLLWMERQSAGQVESRHAGHPELTLLKAPSGNGKDAVAVEGKYTLYSGQMGDTALSFYVFSGAKAKITSE